PPTWISAVDEAGIDRNVVVAENTTIAGLGPELGRVELAAVERGADPAQIDPFEQRHGTAPHEDELGDTLDDVRADSMAMLDLERGPRLVTPVVCWLETGHTAPCEHGTCRDSFSCMPRCTPLMASPRLSCRRSSASAACSPSS